MWKKTSETRRGSDMKLFISENVLRHHLSILAIGVAAGDEREISEAEAMKKVAELWPTLMRIASKYLSDSPTGEDKRQFTIAVLKEALVSAGGNDGLLGAAVVEADDWRCVLCGQDNATCKCELPF